MRDWIRRIFRRPRRGAQDSDSRCEDPLVACKRLLMKHVKIQTDKARSNGPLVPDRFVDDCDRVFARHVDDIAAKMIASAQQGSPRNYGYQDAESRIYMVVSVTPWIVCETCSSLVSADREAARRHGSSDTAPPGCGPAEQMPAAMAAAYAWSLIFNEWPVSVQVNQNPVTHDPKKGTRCDFCRRILYGDEKFGIFHKEMYEKLVADGARFIRTPSPCIADKDGNPMWVACMNCLNHSQSGSPAPVPAPAKSKRPWWKFWT